MKKEEIQKKYNIKFEPVEIDEEGLPIENYKVSKIPCNEHLELYIDTEVHLSGDIGLKHKHVEQLNYINDELATGKVQCFKELLGICKDNKIEIAVGAITENSKLILKHFKDEEIINANFKYFEKLLNISIRTQVDTMEINKFFNLFYTNASNNFILTITNFQFENNQDEKIIINICQSFLFNLNKLFDLYLQPLYFNATIVEFDIITKISNLPKKVLNWNYVDYIYNIVEYFKIGEKADYLPYKFLSYYHVLEYFLDKSSYYSVTRKLKGYLLQPDFLTHMDKYINLSMNLFKEESNRNSDDSRKIGKVIEHFIKVEELHLVFNEKKFTDYFSKDTFILCDDKKIELPAITFDDKFVTSLTNRIYRIRNSIVHSNPDFDPKKAIPFLPTSENLSKLKLEINLIRELSVIIIHKSAID